MIDPGKLRFQKLTETSDITAFHCSDDDLNDFIINEAKEYQKQLLAITTLVYYDGELAAYFSLLTDTVKFGENDKTVRNRINRKIPHSKQRTHYPAVKLGRLAVDTRFARMGLGEMILRNIKLVCTYNSKIAARFITVDAVRNAVGFYEEKGRFRLFTEKDANDDTRLMYFDLKDFVRQL